MEQQPVCLVGGDLCGDFGENRYFRFGANMDLLRLMVDPMFLIMSD